MTKDSLHPSESSFPRSIDRILVETKYRFIGDTLLAIPLLRAIARTWPNAKVTLLSGARACELLDASPVVDSVIEFDPYRAKDRGLGNYIGLLRRLRRERFDVTFVCNRSFHSALTAYLAGSRYRIGWSGFEGRDFLLTHTTPYDPMAPEVDSYLDLFDLVAGAGPRDRSIALWISDRERESVRTRLEPGPWIAIQPGASHGEKQWAPSRFAELAGRLLGDDNQTHIMLVGGPDELAAANAMLTHVAPEYRRRIVSFVGAMTLRETLAALTYANLFIGGDTAIRHAAMALGPATVGLFGPTSVRKWGNADPPRHIALSAPDGKLDGIQVSEVGAAACEARGAGSSVSIPSAEVFG